MGGELDVGDRAPGVGVKASLSESATELLDALEHVLAGGSPGQWWVAFAEHERDLAEAAADEAGVDLDMLLQRARGQWDRTTLLSRADVSDRAIERADEHGRAVADIADVALALVAYTLSD